MSLSGRNLRGRVLARTTNRTAINPTGRRPRHLNPHHRTSALLLQARHQRQQVRKLLQAPETVHVRLEPGLLRCTCSSTGLLQQAHLQSQRLRRHISTSSMQKTRKAQIVLGEDSAEAIAVGREVDGAILTNVSE
jgi:hypothetical protein